MSDARQISAADHEQLLRLHCDKPLSAAGAIEQTGLTATELAAWYQQPRTIADLAALRVTADVTLQMHIAQHRLTAIKKLIDIINEGQGETARFSPVL